MRLRNRPRQKRGISRFLLIFFSCALLLGAGAVFLLFFEGDKPHINLEQSSAHIGKSGNLDYSVTDDQSGIHAISVWATQGDVKKLLHSKTYPRTTYTGPVGPRQESGTVSFDVQKEGFVDGPMTLTFEATDFSLRGWLAGNKTIATKEVIVDTKPPEIEILHSEKYISPGGSGIAIYRVSDDESSHGVNINGIFNPGYPLAGGQEKVKIAYFALPYDSAKIEALYISATDIAGNETVVPFTTVYKNAVQKQDTINISDGFLNKKIPEFQQHYPELQGEFLDKYLFANSLIRKENNQKISELCNDPQPEQLWQDHFARMPGSSRAGYADHRTYYYQGQPIDQQVHLGIDLASTSRADVRAANQGKVVFADYLGIYGKMVLIDHGQGVFSLYSHLSQINVAPGDMVDRQTVIGLTGKTGMAGGDHLHFSMLVNGVFVTPKEWWDQHWIDVTIQQPITDAKS